jgi:hypothetical protein
MPLGRVRRDPLLASHLISTRVYFPWGKEPECTGDCLSVAPSSALRGDLPEPSYTPLWRYAKT